MLSKTYTVTIRLKVKAGKDYSVLSERMTEIAKECQAIDANTARGMKQEYLFLAEEHAREFITKLGSFKTVKVVFYQYTEEY